MKSRIKYWTQDENVRNFGDALSEYLASELFLDIEDNGHNVYLIGSVISDGFVPPPRLDQDGREIEGPRVTFWGCGIRQPESLTLQNYENVELLAVRGPVSASDLRLGASVPTGDPALLLPALYEPRLVQRFHGRRICIPHFHEKRSDRELLDLCGCELVLRPNIAPGNNAIKCFIDALCSASFVLTASLHGAIAAAAYGRPFAFWNIGWLDLPTKWQDTAALLTIPFQLCTTIEEAETFFREEVVPNYRRPPTWQLLSRAPFPLKPVALLKVLDYELRAGACGSEKVGEFLNLFTELGSHFDRLAAGINERRARRWASLGRDVDRAREEAEHARQESVALRSQVDNLSAELGAARTEAAALHESLRAHAEQSEQAAAEAASRTAGMSAELEAARKEAAALHENLRAQAEQSERAAAEAASRTAGMSAELEAARTEAAALHESLRAHAEQSERAAAEAASRTAGMSAELEAARTEAAALHESLRARVEQSERAAAEAGSRTAGMSAELEAARTEAAALHENLRAHAEQSEQAAAEATETRRRLFETNLSVAREVSLSHARLQTLESEKAELLIRVGGLFRNAAARRARSVSLRLAKRLHIRKRHTDDRMLKEAKVIDAFLARIEWSRIGAPSPDGRLDRVIAHLANPSVSLPDLPFFQASLYLTQYPGIAGPDIRPLAHYVVHGQGEARNIHPLVDARHYQSRYPDVFALGLSPIEHFVMIGAEKGYDPHPLFDTRWYKRTYPDVAQSKFNPLADYLRSPFRQPHPLFDPDYYTTMYPDVVANGMNPLTHFLLLGSREGRNPNSYFDTTYYLEQNPDVASAGVNPLVHYIENGASEGRDPHPGFNTRYYLSTYPEVAASGLNPLAHYLTVGRAENRHPLQPVALPQRHARRDAIVMVDGLYPRPDEDSGSLDQISFIKIFRTLGYTVYFASAVEFGADRGPEIAVEEAGAICIRPPTYSSINEFLQRCGEELALCFLSRVHFGGQFKDPARKYAPRSRIVFNTVDLHHVREKRQAEATGDADLLRRADETRRLELSLVNSVDATIVVSRQEEELLARELPGTHVKMIPLVRDYGRGPIAPFSSRAGVAFIGSFQHKPNLDAVDYLLAEIWPAVLIKNPELKLYIIGSHMPVDMTGRVEQNVSFVGYVPNLDFWLSNLKLTVAPLLYGAGAKGKVVTSLSHGVPCVATPIASEGMGLVEDRDILIGRTAQALADQIVRLHASNELWDKLSAAGLALMRAEYSLASGIEKVRELLDAIGIVPPK